MESLKVLHIIEIRGVGGAENLLLDLLHEQIKLSVDVKCIIIYTNQYIKDAQFIGGNLIEKKVEIFYLNYKNKISPYFLMFRIKKLITKINPSIIHTHLFVAELALAILKKLGFNYRVVTTIHGLSFERRSFRLYLLPKRRILKAFDGLIFISQFIENVYKQYSLIDKNVNSMIINNGCRINQIINIKELNVLSIKIILPGRLVNWKGHKYAIEAVYILKIKYPNLVLDFYGIGASENELKRLIKTYELLSNVKLKGFERNINEKYKEYDIVLIPSIMEPFGMVFLEAFNHNKPVVAFDLPAGNEIIRHGYNGRLAKPYSSESLAEEIDFLIQNPNHMKEIAFSAKKELQENYSIQKMAASYMSFYQQVLVN